MGPLDGVRIIELAGGIQGPYASMLLADMGADVIKLESPQGDINRGITIVDAPHFRMSSQFYACNRNKRSICVNLKTPAGLEIARKLIQRSDVLIENMRVGVLDALGLGFDDARSLNPRLVYGSATGFGRLGPRAKAAAIDTIGQAAGGLAAHTGAPETGPLLVGASVADHVGALWLAYGTMLALYGRERTGLGQRVDCSLMGGQIGIQAWEISSFLLTNQESPLRPSGRGSGTGGIYRAADGWFALAGIAGRRSLSGRWAQFCAVLGRADLVEDPRFSTNESREENSEELGRVLEEAFVCQTLSELLPALEAAGFMVSPVLNYDQIRKDPQTVANEYVTSFDSPAYGPVPMIGFPVSLSDTAPSVRRFPPELGEHTAEVLEELEYSWEEIGAMYADGVIGAPAD